MKIAEGNEEILQFSLADSPKNQDNKLKNKEIELIPIEPTTTKSPKFIIIDPETELGPSGIVAHSGADIDINITEESKDINDATNVDIPKINIQAEESKFIDYQIGENDSLMKLAIVHGVSIQYLKRINNMQEDEVFPGQKMKIPLKSKELLIENTKQIVSQNLDLNIKRKSKTVHVPSQSASIKNTLGEISDLNSIFSVVNKGAKQLKNKKLIEQVWKNAPKSTKASRAPTFSFGSENKVRSGSGDLERPNSSGIPKIEEEKEWNSVPKVLKRHCFAISEKGLLKGVITMNQFYLIFHPEFTSENLQFYERERLMDYQMLIDPIDIESAEILQIPIRELDTFCHSELSQFYLFIRLYSVSGSKNAIRSLFKAKAEPNRKRNISVNVVGSICLLICGKEGEKVPANKESEECIKSEFQTKLSELILAAKESTQPLSSTQVGYYQRHIHKEAMINYIKELYCKWNNVEMDYGDLSLPEMDPSNILNQDMQRELMKRLPHMFKLRKWELIFTIDRDGVSMQTFYNLLKPYSASVFGGFTMGRWRIRNGFFGLGETFLFTFKDTDSEIETYNWTGKNQLIMHAEKDLIAIGGGGRYGVSIREDLSKGSSGTSEAFANPIISSKEDFWVKKLEIYSIESYFEVY